MNDPQRRRIELVHCNSERETRREVKVSPGRGAPRLSSRVAQTRRDLPAKCERSSQERSFAVCATQDDKHPPSRFHFYTALEIIV